jgi:hypothetical protein
MWKVTSSHCGSETTTATLLLGVNGILPYASQVLHLPKRRDIQKIKICNLKNQKEILSSSTA